MSREDSETSDNTLIQRKASSLLGPLWSQEAQVRRLLQIKPTQKAGLATWTCRFFFFITFFGSCALVFF